MANAAEKLKAELAKLDNLRGDEKAWGKQMTEVNKASDTYRAQSGRR